MVAAPRCGILSVQRADGYLSRAPGGGRTHNLWLRRPTLYPIELRARMDSELATDSPDFHRFSARPRACASARTLRDFGLQKRSLRRKVCARIRVRWRRVYEPDH